MSNKRVLIVDDEERFLRSTQKLLEKRGYEVDTAGDGLQALDKLKKQDFSLVLLDLRMPNMDGMSTLKRIKRDFPKVEAIMLTGHGTVENAVAGVKLGAADYLIKPAGIDDIVEKIEAALTRKQAIEAQAGRRRQDFSRYRLPLFLGVTGVLWLPYLLLLPLGLSWLQSEGRWFLPGLPTNSALTGFESQRWLIGIGLLAVFLAIPILTWLSVGKLIRRARQLAEKRDELQFQLFHASKLASIGELANGVAHEINNPLAIIVARCGVIQDLLNARFNPTPNPAQIGEEVEIIKQAAFRAGHITHQLLDFGLKGEPRLSLGHLNQILDEIIDGLKAHAFREGGIDIVRHYAPDLPPIMVDVLRLKQVFVNLFNNAVEAIEVCGRIQGRIVMTTEQSGDFIDLTIEDNGIGMTPDQLKRLFQPFYTTKEVGKGTGLSLVVSLSIVESHGGTIEVRSEKGVGSTFVVSLPIVGG